MNSYNEGLQVLVSSKNTQFSKIKPETAKKYINELVRKYPDGGVISDVPKTRTMGIAGKKLEGKYYLEVPIQKKPIPQNVLDYAKSMDVVIRDTTGKAYK